MRECTCLSSKMHQILYDVGGITVDVLDTYLSNEAERGNRNDLRVVGYNCVDLS